MTVMTEAAVKKLASTVNAIRVRFSGAVSGKNLVPDTVRTSKRRIKKIKELWERQEKEKALQEAQLQIAALFHRMEALGAQASERCVLFLLDVGGILNMVAGLLGSRDRYVHWMRTTFQGRHERYFQHARQLTTIGTQGAGRGTDTLMASA